MKKLALAAAFSLTATSVFAGGLAVPVIEAPVIVEDTSSSSPMIVVPLLLLALLAAANQ
ncbi:MAG: hypothetical protein HRT60_09180 [Dinoroseobacter sp.]|nr:hypothetical protein [Dinoroseobacter sp.]NQZ73228.1 hypothetical protein [Dinoroseobacter sp.]